ncbi:MAG: HAD family phosphatase [Oscillospiraceae bacterium]|nr:HAD family phosphatase [Oscillospiraceae bacterium]
MIKNIIFDMGCVLIYWDPDTIIARLGLSSEDSSLLRREVFSCQEWVSMDHGIMSQSEGHRRICSRLPERLHAAAAACVFDWWKPPLRPVSGMEALVRECRDLGYGIYLLSNATSTLHQYFPRIPGSECFDGKIVSADLKLLKPQREIYEALLSTYCLRPEECFFIDDSPLNIDGAWAVGIRGAVFFDDMVRLRGELREAGVPVSPSA